MNVQTKTKPAIKYEEIKYLGELRRLDMKPGDKYVLTVDDHITLEAAARIRETWAKFMGDDTPVLLLDKGWKIGVISDPNYVPDRGEA